MPELSTKIWELPIPCWNHLAYRPKGKAPSHGHCYGDYPLKSGLRGEQSHHNNEHEEASDEAGSGGKLLFVFAGTSEEVPSVPKEEEETEWSDESNEA